MSELHRTLGLDNYSASIGSGEFHERSKTFYARFDTKTGLNIFILSLDGLYPEAIKWSDSQFRGRHHHIEGQLDSQHQDEWDEIVKLINTFPDNHPGVIT